MVISLHNCFHSQLPWWFTFLGSGSHLIFLIWEFVWLSISNAESALTTFESNCKTELDESHYIDFDQLQKFQKKLTLIRDYDILSCILSLLQFICNLELRDMSCRAPEVKSTSLSLGTIINVVNVQILYSKMAKTSFFTIMIKMGLSTLFMDVLRFQKDIGNYYIFVFSTVISTKSTENIAEISGKQFISLHQG